jgi:hypothetical protein
MRTTTDLSALPMPHTHIMANIGNPDIAFQATERCMKRRMTPEQLAYEKQESFIGFYRR